VDYSDTTGISSLTSSKDDIMEFLKDIRVFHSDFDNLGLDSYNFSFEQSDGQKREESAIINNFGSENESIAIRGS
jgi:hypothetical protein